MGLYNSKGNSGDDTYLNIGKWRKYFALFEYNDRTEITPQEIGIYLESVIKGGKNTPFKKIKI